MVVYRPVGPCDPYALTIAAHVFVHVIDIAIRVLPDILYECFKVPSSGLKGGHYGAHFVSPQYFLLGVAKEMLGKLVEKCDIAGKISSQYDAVCVLYEFAVFFFASL